MIARHESELVALRKLAEELAQKRSERTSTGHLLAAIATQSSNKAAELLRDRNLNADVLLKAARVAVDDTPDAVVRALQRAREFAIRSSAPEPDSVHLLFALCQERATAAYRAVTQCGADVTKLRTAAMQRAIGLVGPRRIPGAGNHRPTPPSSALEPRATLRRTITPPLTVAFLPTPVPRPKRPRAHPPLTRHVITPPTKGAEPQFALNAKRYPALTQYGRNLTLAAFKGELDPVVGRDAEIERTLDILAKRHANSPCLIGPAGVGKTSIVRGIAQRIASGQTTHRRDARILIEIDSSALIAGTGVRGALAERLAQIRAEISRGDDGVVVFFDEIHALFSSDVVDEASGELKRALTRGGLACIGATTTEEYRKITQADAALARRFSPVEVEPLTAEHTLEALAHIAPSLAQHHETRYAEASLAASVSFSVRYLPERSLPDKAIGILDLAGARARRRGVIEVGVDHIAEVVSDMAGVPKERLLETDSDRMLRIEELLAEKIIGHRSALSKIAQVLRRNASGFRSRRPIGSFLLLGPTGVGKTETAKAIADLLFYSPYAMMRLDLSEYSESHAVARLVGAPPGYVGHEAGGQLTEAVRRRPYQVLLLDEIEKAHRDVLEVFLPVFDEGRLTDGRGRTVDFTNTVIVLTSNLGADAAFSKRSGKRIGFGQKIDSGKDADTDDPVLASARQALPPEFYNRLDEVLVFAPLDRNHVRDVARQMIASFAAELERNRGVRLNVTEEAIDALLDGGGFDPELGARPMRRAIGRHIEAPIAEMLLRNELASGDLVSLRVKNGSLVVMKSTRTTA